MTGFIDGTENPRLCEAPEVALIPPPSPGAWGVCFAVNDIHKIDPY
ncbi:MAG: hypothetical protein NVSMB38_37220 [Ktedonobacteraceae bacterium]